MKQKRPQHCKGCGKWHCARHKKGTALSGTKYDNWCCKYGKHAPKAIGQCKMDAS